MRKALKERKLQGQLTARASIALSLVALLAAFGCTTNKMPGEGQPYTGGPGFGPTSPTQNIRGTSVPTTPPPMTSSYREQTKSSADMRRLTPDEAAAIMAQYQTQPRVRVLGPAAPGPSNRPYVSDGLITGQVVTTQAPATTINSTIYSQQVGAGVTSGVGNEVGAAIFPAESALVTPTNSSAAIPPVTAASAAATTTLPAPMTSSSASTGTVTSAPVRVNTIQSNAATATGSGNVRVLTASGKVVVTNTGKSQ